MPENEIVRAALVQSKWTGDKDSMIESNVALARLAADDGAQVLCFQELFYGPYFCQVQDPEYFAYTESIPGPTTELMQQLARETHLVLVVPIYEIEQAGVFYNTAVVIDADGTYLGKYRKHHIPQVQGFWEKYYFRPGNLGYPIFQTAVGPIGVYICYDRH
ncbi:MAG: nitrilase-related carbon-nitrogen hydrolase, partial [Acidimicrobiales bacterium]